MQAGELPIAKKCSKGISQPSCNTLEVYIYYIYSEESRINSKLNTVFILWGWNATVDMYSTELTCKACLAFWKYCFGYDTLASQVLSLWWSQYISVLSSFNLIHFIINLFQFQCQVQFQVLNAFNFYRVLFYSDKSQLIQFTQDWLEMFTCRSVGHPSCALDLRLDLDKSKSCSRDVGTRSIDW